MRLPDKFFLAPMAEVTTPALRKTVGSFSPEIVMYSEMLSAGAIVARSPHNEPLVKRHDFDRNFIYQIVGCDPSVMADSCAILSVSGCLSVDVNMGCSAPEIMKRGQGARLLSDPDRARSIIKTCRKSCGTLLSVKMRSGFEKNDPERLVNFARMLEDEGVDFIALHPRYAKLFFTRNADWGLVKLLKEKLTIPVIGNGDITGPEEAVKKIETTGCDGVMIGREAVKSPWIFRLCKAVMDGENFTLDVDAREVFIKTLEQTAEFLPARLHKSRAHRFCFYFAENVKFSHELFRMIRSAERIDTIIGIVQHYYGRNPAEAVLRFETRDGSLIKK